jgi:hypothetical protein
MPPHESYRSRGARFSRTWLARAPFGPEQAMLRVVRSLRFALLVRCPPPTMGPPRFSGGLRSDNDNLILRRRSGRSQALEWRIVDLRAALATSRGLQKQRFWHRCTYWTVIASDRRRRREAATARSVIAQTQTCVRIVKIVRRKHDSADDKTKRQTEERYGWGMGHRWSLPA